MKNLIEFLLVIICLLVSMILPLLVATLFVMYDQVPPDASGLGILIVILWGFNGSLALRLFHYLIKKLNRINIL